MSTFESELSLFITNAIGLATEINGTLIPVNTNARPIRHLSRLHQTEMYGRLRLVEEKEPRRVACMACVREILKWIGMTIDHAKRRKRDENVILRTVPMGQGESPWFIPGPRALQPTMGQRSVRLELSPAPTDTLCQRPVEARCIPQRVPLRWLHYMCFADSSCLVHMTTTAEHPFTLQDTILVRLLI